MVNGSAGGAVPGRESPCCPRQLACWGLLMRVDLIPEPPPSEPAKLPGTSALRASHATAVSTLYASTSSATTWNATGTAPSCCSRCCPSVRRRTASPPRPSRTRRSQPMNPVSLQVHLRKIGVPPQHGRTSVIRQLVPRAPAPVIAKALGHHDQTATRLVTEAGAGWRNLEPIRPRRPHTVAASGAIATRNTRRLNVRATSQGRARTASPSCTRPQRSRPARPARCGRTGRSPCRSRPPGGPCRRAG